MTRHCRAATNNDGNLDIVLTLWTTGPSLGTLINQGNATFSTLQTSASAPYANLVALADLNNDGYADAVVAGWFESGVRVTYGTGTGTFSGSVSYSLPAIPTGLVLADLNQDGKKDIAVGTGASMGVSVLLNTGTAFGSATSIPAGYDVRGVAVADVNGDGINDLVVGKLGANSIGFILGSGCH